MSRQWRSVPGFKNYEVSDTGVVKGQRGVLKPQICRNGYLNVWLYPNGWKSKRYCKGIHQLVLLAFVGPPNKEEETRHLDDNKRNNNLTNLCYGTKRENTQDRLRAGTNGGQKLNRRAAENIRSSQKTGKIIARQLGISESLVSMIRSGKRWN